jgi:hypothetical protein
VGVVPVPDPRLGVLEKIYRPKKVTPTIVEVVDIAGLVKGASTGEGLGNKFLGHVRGVDALLHVVRCFEDPEVIHTAGKVDPKQDIEIIETELILSDLEILDRRIQKIEKKAKSGGKSEREELALIMTLQKILNEGRSLRGFQMEPEQRDMIQDYHLLTLKPLLYVANISDYDSKSENRFLKVVEEIAQSEHTLVIAIAGGTEAELSTLSFQEKQEFISELNLEEPGLNRLINAAYGLLGLLTFFTGGEEEVRAWTVVKGSKAPQGAGKIHSDMERGFIRAEVMSYSDLCEAGSVQKIKERGLLRVEGKDYVIQDGDNVFFRFHV